MYILLILFCLISQPLFGNDVVSVGQDDIIQLVLNSSLDVQIAKEELGIVESSLLGAKSVFDTNLDLSTDHTNDKFKRSSTFFGTRKDTTNWNLNLSKQLPFGTSTSVGWTNQRLKLFGVPTISGTTIFPTEPTYESKVTFSVSQPLMKNFIGKTNRATVNAAKKALASADLNTKFKPLLIEKWWQEVSLKNCLKRM